MSNVLGQYAHVLKLLHLSIHVGSHRCGWSLGGAVCEQTPIISEEISGSSASQVEYCPVDGVTWLGVLLLLVVVRHCSVVVVQKHHVQCSVVTGTYIDSHLALDS